MRITVAGWFALASSALLCACQVVVGTAVGGTAAVIETAYYAGHTVYQGGSAVATAAKTSVASNEPAEKPEKKHDAVVIYNGTFRASSEHSVAQLFVASEEVFRSAGFAEISGAQESTRARRTGKTGRGDLVTATFKSLEDGGTKVEILIGEGNLKQSQFLFDRMLAHLAAEKEGVSR